MSPASQKCANPACQCDAAPDNAYCSSTCEEMSGVTVTHCPCGHAGCVTAAVAGHSPFRDEA